MDTVLRSRKPVNLKKGRKKSTMRKCVWFAPRERNNVATGAAAGRWRAVGGPFVVRAARICTVRHATRCGCVFLSRNSSFRSFRVSNSRFSRDFAFSFSEAWTPFRNTLLRRLQLTRYFLTKARFSSIQL